MDTLMTVLLRIALLIGAIFLTRAIGAWMLRINEVVKYQKEILEELKKITGNKNSLKDQ